jgi:hypothetical protein
MSEIITFMFDPAKLQMNWARASGAINLRADAAGRPGRASIAALSATPIHGRNVSTSAGRSLPVAVFERQGVHQLSAPQVVAAGCKRPGSGLCCDRIAVQSIGGFGWNRLRFPFVAVLHG